MADIIDKLHSIIQSDSNIKNIDIVSSKQLDETEKNEIVKLLISHVGSCGGLW